MKFKIINFNEENCTVDVELEYGFITSFHTSSLTTYNNPTEQHIIKAISRNVEGFDAYFVENEEAFKTPIIFNMLDKTYETVKCDPVIDEVLLRAEVHDFIQRIINDTNWTLMPDSPLSEEQQIQWTDYRRRLREQLTKLSLDDIVWPEPPVASAFMWSMSNVGTIE
ncbi:hypothetical protein KCM76_22955 [Zooshikella marina]|uniref:phage tail assembly chaperone n=1 Tax=Zooshikella ganghwensis TaxID=202772 RepID=UPI001BAFABB6|nr:phage tail assembly chaperone [Zooshikella ganghwensis]MBU2708872.1 hypothetical protein [Zooshikella ganghwensis]